LTAGYERPLERAGRIIESWIPTIYDNKREMGLKEHDDSYKVVTINTAEPYVSQKGETRALPGGRRRPVTFAVMRVVPCVAQIPAISQGMWENADRQIVRLNPAAFLNCLRTWWQRYNDVPHVGSGSSGTLISQLGFLVQGHEPPVPAPSGTS
jgi:hypothetical protein